MGISVQLWGLICGENMVITRAGMRAGGLIWGYLWLRNRPGRGQIGRWLALTRGAATLGA